MKKKISTTQSAVQMTLLCTIYLLTSLLMPPAAHAQLTPSADAYTNSADPTTNYGAGVQLDVESTQTTYIQFNLSSIPSTYTSADVTQATLKLYVNAVTTAGSFNVDYVNGAWVESTITHTLAPALGTTIVASVPLTTADKNQYILINVTAAVQAWLSGTPNDGIALVGNSPVNASFDSKENTTTSHPPELDIVFLGGGTIAGVTTASGSGLIGGGTSGTLNLSLTKACAANQVLKWNGTAWACSSTGTGTITGVTAGTDLTGSGTSGNVTLSLNTTATNALYARLGAANTFTANQTLNGTLTATSSGSADTINATTSNANSVAVSGSGAAFGMYGTATSTSGVGVQGYATAASGSTDGVVGLTLSSSGTGVDGVAQSTTGATHGVFGVSNSPGGYGVYGENYVTSGTTAGVYGATASSNGYGVEGYNFAPSGGNATGVYGFSAASFGLGVWGAGTLGVYGEDTSALGDGLGMEGVTPNGTGVFGSSASYIGVNGVANGYSGTGDNQAKSAGLWGDTGSQGGDFVGVLATADETYALLAENTDPSGDYPTIAAENFTTATHNPVFQTSSPNTYEVGGKPGTGTRHCTIDTSANLTCSGVLTAVVSAGDGKRTALYAMQSAENWFEDAGSGQLSNGSARIELDSAFAQTVNAGVEYHVFLTPNGDSRGLYVSHKTATSFEVHEQGGGTSSIGFDYRIMAKRKGYENVRLEDVTERFKERAPVPHKARPPRPSLKSRAPQSVPKMPTSPMQPLVTPRPVSAAPKLLFTPPVRAAVQPLAAESK